MSEYAIFLHPTDPSTKRPFQVIREHCAHLGGLDEDGRLIAAGPFGGATDGGMVVGRFASFAEAEEFARNDPFVREGYSRAEIRSWEWSHPENGHLGVLAPAPGSHPRFLSTLLLRSTTRRFSERPIDEELARSLLHAALAAPSEFNLQPWRPVACHSPADRMRLQRCCLDQPQVGAAGLVVISAIDPAVFTGEAPRAADEWIASGRRSPEQRDAALAFIRSCYRDPRDSAIRNGAIFGHQLLLAGLSQGLAGFWLGGFDEEAIRREFCIPARAILVGVVGLGWPEGREEPMPRQPFERLVGWGRWPGPV